jgi:hypothetical protein
LHKQAKTTRFNIQAKGSVVGRPDADRLKVPLR